MAGGVTGTVGSRGRLRILWNVPAAPTAGLQGGCLHSDQPTRPLGQHAAPSTRHYFFPAFEGELPSAVPEARARNNRTEWREPLRHTTADTFRPTRPVLQNGGAVRESGALFPAQPPCPGNTRPRSGADIRGVGNRPSLSVVHYVVNLCTFRTVIRGDKVKTEGSAEGSTETTHLSHPGWPLQQRVPVPARRTVCRGLAPPGRLPRLPSAHRARRLVTGRGCVLNARDQSLLGPPRWIRDVFLK